MPSTISSVGTLTRGLGSKVLDRFGRSPPSFDPKPMSFAIFAGDAFLVQKIWSDCHFVTMI